MQDVVAETAGEDNAPAGQGEPPADKPSSTPLPTKETLKTTAVPENVVRAEDAYPDARLWTALLTGMDTYSGRYPMVYSLGVGLGGKLFRRLGVHFGYMFRFPIEIVSDDLTPFPVFLHGGGRHGGAVSGLAGPTRDAGGPGC